MSQCATCRYHDPRLLYDHTVPCQFASRPEGDACVASGEPAYRPIPPVELCRECTHAHFSTHPSSTPWFRYPWCGHQANTPDGDCAGFAPRPPHQAPPCPICGETLALLGNELRCPQGHAFRLRAGRNACPHCGRIYRTFSAPHARHSSIRWRYHYCSGCGWHERETVEAPHMAFQGRGHGGQRYSPCTGRLLAK